MDCRQCTEDMTAYLDGELAEADAEQMKVHLNKCDSCSYECDELRESKTLVATHAAEILPAPEIWNNLRARIQEMPPPVGSSGFFRFLVVNRWATAVATLAATVLLAIGMWGYMQYRQTQSDLESYMNDYIEMRNIAERLHSLRMADSAGRPASMETRLPGAPENPFADIRPVSFNNPFRVEER
jgi:anti-sigma factor RsiW